MNSDASKHDILKTKLNSTISKHTSTLATSGLWRITRAPLVIGAIIGSLLALPLPPNGMEEFRADSSDEASYSTVRTEASLGLRSGDALRAASRSMAERNQIADAVIAEVEEPTEPEFDPTLPATSVSAAGLQKLKDFEGFSLRGYLLGDGKCTIGWGHAVPVAQRPDCVNWVITEEEARAKFAGDVSRFEDAVNNFFTRDFNQNQFDAIVSFAYNVGQVWFRWDWPTDPDDDFFQWVLPLYIYPVQFREGLMRRRAAELELFNTPVA